MAVHTRQGQLTPEEWAFHGVTVGTVVDTNDPQQMGRVRAVCLSLGDDPNTLITDLPWASYAAPFGGTTQVGTKGPNAGEQMSGPVAYGLWGIPKVGAQVLIMCLDGDPLTRIWIGCLPTQSATHTMPHGRFTYQDNPEFLPESDTKPVGPLTGFETSIEPTSTNFKQAFGSAPSGDHNFEFASRAADYQVSGISPQQVPVLLSNVSDDRDEPTNVPQSAVPESRQGYQTNRQNPDQFVPEALGGRNLDNQVTSIVSPGFHAISMDDREENSRIRIRSVGGHQIILDDTNERIYISTAKGENWIEIDQAGNIDIFTSGKLNAHATEDINFTTDSSFRVYAKKGIHLKSDIETRITSEEDISIKSLRGSLRARSQRDAYLESTEQDVQINAGARVFATGSEDIDIKAGRGLSVQAGRDTNILSGSQINMESSSTVDITSGTITIQGSKLDLNPGGSRSASSAQSAEPSDQNDDFNAFFPNRVPDHEPWARVDTLNNETIDPQFDYTSNNIGKILRLTGADGKSDQEKELTRGELWRR